MKQVIVLILASLLYTSALSQDISLIKYDKLATTFEAPEDQLLLVNFWATWCGPCIKELPHFLEANDRKDVKVMLVSVDFPQDMEKVKKFVTKRQIDAKVYVLDEKDYDYYMPKVSENWTGAIPATLIIDSFGDRYFYEKSFSKEELQSTINKHLN